MRGAAVLILALALAGCHRSATSEVTLDADQDARNATAAKIDADLAAADAAARAPLPQVRPAPVVATPASSEQDDARVDDTPSGDNGER